jgi:CRISPR/Cas system-associated protein Csm6
MNRRLIVLAVFLLAGAAVAFYITTDKKQPVLLPPVELPVPPVPPVQQKEPLKQAAPAVGEAEEESEAEPRGHTVRTLLQKQQLTRQQSPADTTFTLKKAKAREIVPGVTVENKELRIQLEQANESLHIRRSNNEQVQMLWKQKF